MNGENVGADRYCKDMGERLRSLRRTYGFTQTQVARFLAMDQSNYSKIEHGKRRLRWLSQLERLCILYDCTQDYILLRSDDYVPQSWQGLGKGIDLEIIFQANQTMRYLRLLRNLEKENRNG